MENTTEKDTLLHLVTFRLETQVYALPIEPIQQVIEMVTITPVPQVRTSVEGVINFHGATVPIVNLREHLGMPKIPMKLHTPIIMVIGSGRLVGLIVDEVVAVVDLPPTQVANPQDILPEGLGKTSILRGMFHANGKTILVLDIEHLFAPQVATALAEAAAVLPIETRPAKRKKPAPQDLPHPKGKKKRAIEKTQAVKKASRTGSVESPA